MKILFVCSSNVCRSPYAEFWTKKLVEQSPILKSKIEWVKSGAVVNHSKKLHSKAKVALMADGFSESQLNEHKPSHQGKCPQRFDEADIIIGMTNSHKFFLKRRWKNKYINLSEWATGQYAPIPDPWLICKQSKYNDCMRVILNYIKKGLKNIENND